MIASSDFGLERVKSDSRVFRGCFKGRHISSVYISQVLGKSCKCILRGFQGLFRNVPMVFHECFMGAW